MKQISTVSRLTSSPALPPVGRITRVLGLTLLALGGLSWARAGSVPVANASFEEPATVFADPRIDAWQKSPKPAWYDESGGAVWDQLSGVFLNTAPGSGDHIENLDGPQAAFLFALPEVALHQELIQGAASSGGAVRYQVGRSYRLTVGVLGGGGGMSNGVTAELRLQYRDATSNRVMVASTVVTNTPAAFPSRSRLTDYEVRVPAVRSTDPWAGAPVAVQFLSTVAPELAGGYWDIDHVRLEEAIEVPNGSFEGPATVFADPRIEVWQKSPKPAWYDESGGYLWEQLTGVFLNTAVGSVDHVENLDLNQGLFLFALPEVSVFQDAESVPDTGLEVRFEPGRSYGLTAGVLGGGGGMSNGVTLELRVYYRDPAGERVPVAVTVVTHTPTEFPSRNRLVDYAVAVPVVNDGDPWAGRPLGIEFRSTVAPDLGGGYWDLDQVRLVESWAPRLSSPGWTDDSFGFVIESQPGMRVEVLVGDSPGDPVASWTSVGIVRNVSGRLRFVDPAPGLARRFYQVRQLP